MLLSGKKEKMAAIILILLTTGSPASLVPAMNSKRRAKRISFGEPLPSLDTYKMYYFVQLRRSWACITDQTDHENSLNLCQVDYNKCGGTLIHPEFVLTAAHCVMYFEVILYEKGTNRTDDWVRDKGDLIYYSLIEAWEKFKHAIIGFFIVPKPRHTVYSDWALLVGSNDWYKMKQKRHVLKVFPHRIYPKEFRSKEAKKAYERTKNSWHDVTLLQACQEFKIKSGEVEIAPMLNTVDSLRQQYERIVTSGMVCLYVGFGQQDNNDQEAKKAGYPQFQRNLMLHTWRTSKCNSACNSDLLSDPSTEHACNLCSWHLGKKLGIPGKGDSGSPVTCEGKFVSSLTKALLVARQNYTRADSYPLHCIKHAITEERLTYYMSVPRGQYHPLNGTRLRRFPLPID